MEKREVKTEIFLEVEKAVKQRRGFTKELKTDAVKLVIEQGYRISEASRNLCISTSVLRQWRDQLKNEGEQAPGQPVPY